MLTQRTVVTLGETFTKQLGLDDANLTRDAIVKSLYEVQCRYTFGKPRVKRKRSNQVRMYPLATDTPGTLSVVLSRNTYCAGFLQGWNRP